MQEDIHTTCWNAYGLANSIVSGTFPNGYYFESAFYIPVHIAFAIWNLPVFIISKFGIGNPSSVYYLLWAKLLIIVCLYLSIKFMKRILDEAEMGEHSDFWALFIVTSFTVFAPIFDMSQYDIVSVALGLYAFASICKDPSKLTVKQLLLLSLASSYKIFFLFASITIVFVLERKFTKVLAKTGIVLSFSIFFVVLSKVLNILRSGLNVLTLVASNGEDLGISYSQRLFFVTLPSGLYNMSVIFLCLFAVYFLIFLKKKPETKKELIYEMVWSCAAVYSILVLFAIAHPQWSIFPGIFILLICALSKKSSTKGNIILEFIFECSLLIQQFSYYSGIYASSNEFNKLLLKNYSNHLFGPDWNGPGDILHILGQEKPMYIISALTCVAAFAILIRNNPWKPDNDEPVDEKCLKNAARVRAIFLALYIISAFAFRFVL